MKFIFILITLHAQNLLASHRHRSLRTHREGSTLKFPALALTYGYKTQEHDVTTEDGYILKMFNIPGNKTKSVLLMHGLFDSANTFILRGHHSLAAALADRGYDVWLGNVRGNRYSRRHERLNPDTDKKFWDFSFHEMGTIDLPTFMDFILRKNNIGKLSLIGHSQGNTLFCVLGSMKPEYNEKVNIAIALGPACMFDMDYYQFPLSNLLKVGPMLNQWLIETNQEELFGETAFLTQEFRKGVCAQRGEGYETCAKLLFAQVADEDLEELEPNFYYTVIEYYPTSSSRKDLEHFLQVTTQRKFVQFDYGPRKNLVIYESVKPSAYNLNNVTMKIALLMGKNDNITPLKGAEILKSILPNVVSYHVMERAKFNHLDHIWGKHTYKYLFPFIFGLLENFG